LEILFQEYILNYVFKAYDIAEEWYEEFEKLHTEGNQFIWKEDIEKVYQELKEIRNMENENIMEILIGNKYVYESNELYDILIPKSRIINLFESNEFHILIRLVEHIRYFFKYTLCGLISDEDDGISSDNIFIFVEIDKFLHDCFHPISRFFTTCIYDTFDITVKYEQYQYKIFETSTVS